MTACTRRAVSMCTDCFAADDIAAAARRTGFVKRASTITGKLFLALVTFGSWSDARTTLAQWAAKVTPWGAQRDGSPAALPPRLHTGALALLQDLLRQALAKLQAIEPGGAAGLWTDFPQGSLAERTGGALPDRRPDLWPGSGGSGATAGATMQAGGDEKSRVCGQCALPPWPMPEQPDVAPVVA